MEATLTCKRSWQKCLRQTLSDLPRAAQPPRVAVVGVGHEFRGDDFAGPAAVRALQACLPPTPYTLVLDAGAAPESFTGPLRRFAPDLIVILDAAVVGEMPGDVGWIDPDGVAQPGEAPRAVPLPLFAGFLSASLGCPVRIIGIRPAADDFDTPLSAVVAQAVEALAADLATILG